MKRSTFKVLFYVKRQSEKSGQVSIMGRITINGTMSQFSCKLSAPISLWDTKANKAAGKDRSVSTFKNYSSARRYLASFLKYEYKVEDVLFKELKRDFIEKFVAYLSSVRNMLPGSIVTSVKKLKLMAYTAYKNDWIPVNPFTGFYVKPEYGERRYLSASELQAVMNVHLPNYRTGINRDAFVFCAFTGMSHADVVKLTHADIHTDDNGDRWIIDKRRKTGTQFRVKLLPVAEKIYDRYKYMQLPGHKVFHTKRYSLRHVAKYAGLSFNPTMHMARHNKSHFLLKISILRQSVCWQVTF